MSFPFNYFLRYYRRIGRRNNFAFGLSSALVQEWLMIFDVSPAVSLFGISVFFLPCLIASLPDKKFNIVLGTMWPM